MLVLESEKKYELWAEVCLVIYLVSLGKKKTRLLLRFENARRAEERDTF